MRRVMTCPALFFLAALLAGLAPFAARSLPSAVGADAFPGWPAAYEGKTLTPLPVTEREAALGKSFPGRVGRFTDGQREIILRWVATPTRQLHPSADCFKAIGYRIETRPMRLSANGRPMSCYRATSHRDAFEVCEQVTGTAGGSWPDVSAWYWHALWRGRGAEAWWSVVVAEKAARP